MDLLINLRRHDDVDRKIVMERNAEIRKLEKDLYDIDEIYRELSKMIDQQGKEVDISEKNVETVSLDVSASIRSLANAEEIVAKRKRIIRDLIIVLGGVGLGTLGFIAGPIIGLGTLLSGAGVGGGIVYASHKVED